MEQNLNRRLKDKIGNETMELKTLTQVPGSSIEAMKDINSYNKELGEKTEETKEATSSGASGQFSQPLFSMTKKELEEKWSNKYKNSIDCKNPKGFSQKAYCKGKEKLKEEKIEGGVSDKMTLKDIVKKHDKKGYYHIDNMMDTLKKQLEKGIKVEMEHTNDEKIAKEIAMDHLWEDPNYYTKLKKVEATEATSTSSSGQYSTPAFVAKNSKNWRGAKKPLFPGGKFVKVKEKCKKFPYCNQGDINALKLTENNNNVVIENVIKKISKKYGVTEMFIKNILSVEHKNISQPRQTK
jgi:hypothetical protein